MSVLFYTAKNKREAGERLVKLVSANKGMQENRRLLAAKYASLYEGLQLTGLAPYSYSTNATAYFREDRGEQIPIIRNAAHSIVDTFVSKIAALETPKPSFMTTHGSWSDRRIAKQLELLVESEFYEPQGRFATLEELWIHAVRIAAAATGTVAVKVCVYPNEGKVSHEIHDTLTMSFDFGELTYGELLTVGETTWFDVERAVEIWGTTKENEDLIRKSVQKPPEEFWQPWHTGEVTEMVAIHEGWRGTHGTRTGKYCAAVKDGCLEFKDYDFARPPFVWLTIDPHLYGILGHCLVHQIFESVRRDNLIKSKIDKGVSKAVRNTIFIDQNKLVDPTALDVIEDDTIINMTDPNAVKFESAQGFHSSHPGVADGHWMDAHNVSGIPEMHTASKAEPGVTAAIADRQVAARLNERFAAFQRRYVQAVAVDNAKMIVQGLKEVRDQGKFTRLWPGQKFLKEITSDALDLPENKYKVRPVAVSGRANTAEGRLQSAFELRQMGILSDAGYAAVQSGYDTPEELSERDTEREWLENEINRWLYSPDEDLSKPDFYRPPLKYMDLGAAIERMKDGILEAQMEELEPDRMEFFLIFLSDIDAALVQRAQMAQQGAAPNPPQQALQGGVAPAQLAAPAQAA